MLNKEITASYISRYIEEYDEKLASDLPAIEEEFAEAIGSYEGELVIDFMVAVKSYVRDHWISQHGVVKHRLGTKATSLNQALRDLGGLYDADWNGYAFPSKKVFNIAQDLCYCVYYDRGKDKIRLNKAALNLVRFHARNGALQDRNLYYRVMAICKELELSFKEVNGE